MNKTPRWQPSDINTVLGRMQKPKTKIPKQGAKKDGDSGNIKKNDPEIPSLTLIEKMEDSLDKDKLTIDGYKQEYTEVCANNRHYSNLRFAIFTACFLIFGGLVSLIYGDKTNFESNPSMKLQLKMGGLLVSIIFFIFEWYCSGYLLRFIERAKELEKKLGYKQFTNREEYSWHPARFLANCPIVIYASLIIFWIFQVFYQLFYQ